MSAPILLSVAVETGVLNVTRGLSPPPKYPEIDMSPHNRYKLKFMVMSLDL